MTDYYLLCLIMDAEGTIDADIRDTDLEDIHVGTDVMVEDTPHLEEEEEVDTRCQDYMVIHRSLSDMFRKRVQQFHISLLSGSTFGTVIQMLQQEQMDKISNIHRVFQCHSDQGLQNIN